MDRTRTWNPRRKPLFRSFLRCAALALLALPALSCGEPAKAPKGRMAQGAWHAFEGTGSSTGRVQLLRLDSGRTVSIISLTGSLVLTGPAGLPQGFRTESVGFADSLTGATAWSVWTDSNGDRVFSEVRGKAVGTGNRFVGTLLGGTGRYAGGSGEYEFEWQFVVQSDEGTIHGRAAGLRGRFRQDAAPASRPERKGSLEGGGRDRGFL